jgi:hypothetical protein
MFMVIKRTFDPMLAAAAAASQPACPAPTTMMSYLFIPEAYIFVSRETIKDL